MVTLEPLIAIESGNVVISRIRTDADERLPAWRGPELPHNRSQHGTARAPKHQASITGKHSAIRNCLVVFDVDNGTP